MTSTANLPGHGEAQTARRDYISFSAIRTYQTCPLRYFFKYLAGLPEESVAAALVFGTSIHRAIEYHFRELMLGHSPPGTATLFEHYQAGWLERESAQVRFGKDEGREDLDSTAQRMLEAFTVSESARPDGHILAIEETLRGTVIPGLPDLLGRIDLILETERELVIADWKTSRNRWSAEQARESSEQLLLYSELARDLAPHKRLQMQFTVLTKTKHILVEEHRLAINRQQVERAKRVVERVWHAIEAGHFYPTPSPLNCAGCPFQEPCHQWQG